MPHIFISYPDEEKDIVGNLRGRLREYHVDAWAYSHDKTLGRETWEEIKNKISKSREPLAKVFEKYFLTIPSNPFYKFFTS